MSGWRDHGRHGRTRPGGDRCGARAGARTAARHARHRDQDHCPWSWAAQAAPAPAGDGGGPGRPIPMDRLADRIWPARLPADPRLAAHPDLAAADCARSRRHHHRCGRVHPAGGGGRRWRADRAGRVDVRRSVRDAEVEGVGLLRRLHGLLDALELWRGARPSTNWPARSGRSARSSDCRSSVWSPWSDGSTPCWRWVGTSRPCRLSQAVRGNTRCATGSSATTCWRCSAPAGRRRRRRAFQATAGSASSSGSNPASPWPSSIDASSAATTLLGEGSAPSSGRWSGATGWPSSWARARSRWCSDASQPTLDREVAVKVIRAELADHPEFVRRFEAEAQLVASLEHPHVVPLYDFWREPGRACLVFRYLRGGSLASRLRTAGPLRPDHVRTLIAQVGAALAAAHRAGVSTATSDRPTSSSTRATSFYLGDFGIAAAGHSPQDDIRGLAATVRQALTGELDPDDAIELTDDGGARACEPHRTGLEALRSPLAQRQCWPLPRAARRPVRPSPAWWTSPLRWPGRSTPSAVAGTAAERARRTAPPTGADPRAEPLQGPTTLRRVRRR
ncbi:MAG: protein kinase [Acidimicrobiales bacterium]